MLRIGQIETTATADKKYTDGSVAGGVAATRLRAAAFNAMQEELAHIVEEAGLTLDVNDMTQVLTGLQKLFLTRKNPFSDIKADGPAAVATALSNLGLGGLASGGFAIGMPFFWPSLTPPNLILPEWSGMQFLKWNDATFSATAFPKLALVIPSLKLTESRGEFIRVRDDGRGVDPGRELLSAQGDAIRNITASVTTDAATYGATGAFSMSGSGPIINTSTTGSYAKTLNFSVANAGLPTASENRPRSVAFNFLVRAA